MDYDHTERPDGGTSLPPHDSRKAPPNPPSPRRRGGNRQDETKTEIPWGDRKPAASPGSTGFEMRLREPHRAKRKDGDASGPGASTKRARLHSIDGSRHGGIGEDDEFDDATDSENPSEPPIVLPSQAKANRMSKRELLWVSVVFAVIVFLAVATTLVVVFSRKSLLGNKKTNSPSSSTGVLGVDRDGSGADPKTNDNDNDSNNEEDVPRLSAREEWELVYRAIGSNPVTKSLLEEHGGGLPYFFYVYQDLVQGMVFSEADRDWIPVSADEKNSNDPSLETILGTGGGGSGGSMSMDLSDDGSNNNYKPYPPQYRELTPNEKATTWLLFHDTLKDPRESVWRWALASIYFRTNGPEWAFGAENWFTGAPLCDWELLGGGSGCDPHKHPPGAALLPVELDWADLELQGKIAAEFALLVQPTSGSVGAGSTVLEEEKPEGRLTSISFSGNMLTGTIPGEVFEYLMPTLGKLYLDDNLLSGSVPLELGGLGTLYVQHNLLTGDWPMEFCNPEGDKTVYVFGMDCDTVECLCCVPSQCYTSW